jgi:hypothetical protein
VEEGGEGRGGGVEAEEKIILPPILKLEKAAGRFCDILRSKTILLSRMWWAVNEKSSKESG